MQYTLDFFGAQKTALSHSYDTSVEVASIDREQALETQKRLIHFCISFEAFNTRVLRFNINNDDTIYLNCTICIHYILFHMTTNHAT